MSIQRHMFLYKSCEHMKQPFPKRSFLNWRFVHFIGNFIGMCWNCKISGSHCQILWRNVQILKIKFSLDIRQFFPKSGNFSGYPVFENDRIRTAYPAHPANLFICKVDPRMNLITKKVYNCTHLRKTTSFIAKKTV